MTGAGIRGSIQSFRDLPDNPVVLLLERQQRSSSDRLRGWLARPMFLLLAFLLMLAAVAFILRQFWMLSQLPAGTVHPLFVSSARHTAVGAVLWFYGLLYMLLAWSYTLSGFQHGVMLLSPQGSRGSGMRLDDLLRSAPLDTTDVINGLLWFHLIRVARALAVPAIGLAILTAIIVYDQHIDNANSMFALDWLYVLLMPALFLGVLLFLSTIATLAGVTLGMRLKWPLLGHVIFGLACLGLLWLFRTAADCTFMAFRFSQYEQSFANPWHLLWPVFLLFFILLFVVNRRLAFNAIERRQRAGDFAVTPQENAATAGHSLHPRWWIAERTARSVLLATPVICAAVLFIHTAGLRYSPIETGDALYDWYQQYVLELSQEGLNAGPVRGNPFWFFNYRWPGNYWSQVYLDPVRFAEVNDRFSGDSRWTLLRIGLVSSDYSNLYKTHVPAGSEYLSMTPAMLVQQFLEEAADNEVHDPVIDFIVLKEEWGKVCQAEQIHGASSGGPATVQAGQVRELEPELEELAVRFEEFAKDCNEAFPLYWLAIQLLDRQPQRSVQLMQQGNSLPCNSCFSGFLPGFIDAISADPQAKDHHILLGMHGNVNRFSLNYDRTAYKSKFVLHPYTHNMAAQGELASLDAAVRMLNRLYLNSDSDGKLFYYHDYAVTDAIKQLRQGSLASAEQKQELGLYELKLARLISTQTPLQFSGFSPWGTPGKGRVLYLPFANAPRGLEENLLHAEEMLSLGHLSMLNCMDPNTTSSFNQALDVRCWLRQNRSGCEELLDFDFETLSWTDAASGNDS